MPDKKRLFIVHEASRNGAPILVLTFLRWLKAQHGSSFDVLILKDGPLRSDFQALCPTFLADAASGRSSFSGRLTNKLFKRDGRHWVTQGTRRLASRNYDIVYANSIVCLDWMDEFKRTSRARCVCAVHELSLVLDAFWEKSFITEVLGRLDAVVAGSQTVADNLVKNYGVERSLIQVAHAFVDKDVRLTGSKAQLREQLGLQDGVVVIGGVGTPELRKGTDLVVPLAARLRSRFPEFRFRLVWLGGVHWEHRVFKSDAVKAGVSDCISFVDSSPLANDYINLFDVFILPSREDPFPLVALTAATLGKPIVAFEQGGGMVELLSDGAGALVPYLDVDKFADAVHTLATDPALARKMGDAVAARLKADFDPESASRSLLAAIEGHPAMRHI